MGLPQARFAQPHQLVGFLVFLVLEYTAKMVPESCCVKNQYGDYFDLQKCQNWRLGPPNRQSAADRNEAVFYKVRDVISIAIFIIRLGLG